VTAAVALPLLRERLLAHLRRESGCPDLAYRRGPEPMTGGFSAATLYGFELDAAPVHLGQPLVLRVLSGNDCERRMKRESVVQETAAQLGFPTPRVRMVGEPEVGLGGPFVVMDRLRGRSLARFWFASLAAGALGAVMLRSVWPFVAGHLFGCAWVGLVMARYQLRLHRIPIEAVRARLAQGGLDDRELDPDVWLQTAERAIGAQRLDGYAPGLRWLREHGPVPSTPTLCHGDIQPLNMMATWTGAVGVLDWELTCVADPELDVAVAKSDLTLLPGPWLGALFSPIYAAYVLTLRLVGRVDRARLRYYEALRAFVMLTMVAEQFRATQANRVAGAEHPAGTGPDLPPFFARMVIRAHERRFLRLTGVRVHEHA
jgi:aminoglycoside phosphotransferase (APT) family kinase protein